MTILLRHLAFHLSTTWAAVTTNTAPPSPDIGNPPEHWAEPGAVNEALTASAAVNEAFTASGHGEVES